MVGVTTVRVDRETLQTLKQISRWNESLGETIARIVREWEVLRLIREIEHWDKEDVRDLREALHRLEDLDSNALQLVDLAHLPSQPIPPDVPTTYSIWAMDKHGMCLVGKDMEKIEHIFEIREGYRELEEEKRNSTIGREK